MHLCECAHQYRWSWSFGQEIHLCAIAYLVQELKHQTKHMRDRQHTQHFITCLVRNTFHSKVDISTQVLMANHHALRITSRARSIIDQCQLINIISRIFYICCFHAFWPFFLKYLIHSSILLLHLFGCSMFQREIIHKHHRSQAWHLIGVNLLQYIRSYI